MAINDIKISELPELTADEFNAETMVSGIKDAGNYKIPVVELSTVSPVANATGYSASLESS